MGGVLIAKDRNALQQRADWFKKFLTALHEVPGDDVLEALRSKSWLVGTPEEIARQLGEWSAVGVQRVMLQYYDLDDMDGLGLLAEVANAM